MEKLTIIIFTLIAVGGLLGIVYIAIYNRLQKYTIRIIKSLSFSLTPKLSEHSGYRNDPFVHCSRNCINVDYFQ